MYNFFLRPILSCLSHEFSQAVLLHTMKWLSKIPMSRSLIKFTHKYEHENLQREVFGLNFKNPIGLAAGFDTNAEYVDILADYGFSFIEVGSFSPDPQKGADRPRVLGSIMDKAFITKLGIRNKGVRYAISKLEKSEHNVIIAGNIIPNASSKKDEEIIRDYTTAFSLIYDFVDIIVVNVSCPNENGIQMIQDKATFVEVMEPILDLRLCYDNFKPIVVKVSPNLSIEQLDGILDYCMMSGIDGIIAGNYSKLNHGMIKNEKLFKKIGFGFISGAPLYQNSLAMVKHISEHTKGRFPVIGCGGIMTPDQAKEMLDAGAYLVQMYSGIHFKGPRLVKKSLKFISPKK